MPNLQFLDSSEVKITERLEAKRRGKYLKIVRPTSSANLVGDNNSTPNNLTPLPCSVRNLTDFKSLYSIYRKCNVFQLF